MPTPIENIGRLGRRVAKDPRDLTFALPRVAEAPAGRKGWFARPAWDQGSTSQCVAFSTLKWLEAGPIGNAKPTVLYPDAADVADARGRFYTECQQNDEWPGEDYDGTSVRAAFKLLNKRGVVPSYHWAYDVPTCAAWLLNQGPMVFGTVWTVQMFYPDKHGFIRMGEQPQIVGGHAYLVIGANTSKRCPDGSTGAFRILNSWGAGWGQKGRAWLSFTDTARLLADDGEACCAKEIRIVQ